MKKAIAIFLTILILCSVAGCAGRQSGDVVTSDTQKSAAAPDAVLSEKTAATPEPTENPAAAQALGIAKKHGLSEADLRGEYELFIRFSETVEENSDLGRYKEFVYLIFPVAAAASDYMDLDFFFKKLSELRFIDGDVLPFNAGEYSADENTVSINTEVDPSLSYQLPETVFHELMHFIDFNVNGETPAMYLQDGKPLKPYELDGLSPEEMDALVVCYNNEVVVEGGAEYFTAKYFSGGMRAYFIPSYFMAGFEYIYGEEKLNELFFSSDSGVVLAEDFLDAGYSKEEFYAATDVLNYMTNSDHHDKPSADVAPEDILIDLYEHKLGDGWQKDEGFLYILKAMNGVTGTDFEKSERADFLRNIEFNSWGQYDAFTEKVYRDFNEQPQLAFLPPVPVMREGRLMLGTFAEWTDTDTQKTVRGTITVDYDFNTEKPLGCVRIDMDEIVSRYMG